MEWPWTATWTDDQVFSLIVFLAMITPAMVFALALVLVRLLRRRRRRRAVTAPAVEKVDAYRTLAGRPEQPDVPAVRPHQTIRIAPERAQTPTSDGNGAMNDDQKFLMQMITWL